MAAIVPKGLLGMSRDGHDKTIRGLYLLHILNCNPDGITVPRLAEFLGVNRRTVYRDLHGLDDVYHASVVWQDKGLWGLNAGFALPPVVLTQEQAMTVYMASRLLLAQSSVYNEHIESTFRILSSIVRPPLRDEIDKTLKWMKKHKPDSGTVKILDILTNCWNERRQARIKYRALGAKQPTPRTIEPYFIQPSALEHAIYIIAFCRLRSELRVFRLDRIQEARAMDETYDIPEDFDANEYLNRYWSITVEGEPREIKLRFRPEVARIAWETVWHDSQITQQETDGSAVVTMKLALTRDLVSFILGWGEMVEVLSPRGLQRRVAETARKVFYYYDDREAELEPGLVFAMAPPKLTEPHTEDYMAFEHEPQGTQLPLFE